jgi:succinate dehydrogenase / fumarate reductase iron-sulfur subunit
MLVNGVERLTCITPIHEVTQDGGTIKLEPLRNFPVVSDLVVDLAPLYTRMDEINAPTVMPVSSLPDAAGGIDGTPEPPKFDNEPILRLVDCIECGLCISACPVQATNPDYIGPAIIAAAHLEDLEENPSLLNLLENPDGIWRCHSAFECTAVCPANVEPAWRIMEMRKRIVKIRFEKLF